MQIQGQDGETEGGRACHRGVRWGQEGTWGLIPVDGRRYTEGVSLAVLSVVLGAWSARCVGRVDWVDCRCFLSFVFLSGARRLELSPCNTHERVIAAAHIEPRQHRRR